MICVIPFCSKDAALAHDLLLWCGQLGGTKSHPCLLVCDAATSWNDAWKAVDLAEKAFASVKVITNGTPVEGWIPGSNSLFKAAAEWCAGQSFMWLEPDATPLRSTWLDELESAYAKCGKPFMGTIVNHLNANFPNPYLEGNGVYPPDCWQRFKDIWNPDKSWTYAMVSVTIPNAVHTDLLEHVWGQNGNPPTFSDMNIPGTSVFSLAKIKPKSAVWHRNKDGSLIRLLRKRMGIHVPEPSRNGTMRVVSLRRSGDIIALLPLLRQFSKTKEVELVVHSDFMPLLEGVSYVRPLEWKGGWEQPLDAAKLFHAQNAQVYGQGVRTPPNTNFARHAWELLKTPWNRYYPLVFDNRNESREAELAERVFTTDKPKILLKLHGFSSPMQGSQQVRDSIVKTFSETAEVVDLDAVKAERIYDVLGLMDRSDCLVSIDTYAVHLNRSHRIPTIALVHGNKWRSSPSVGNVVFRCGYDQVMVSLPKIHNYIRLSLQPDMTNEDMVLAFKEWKPKDPSTLLRVQKAMATWENLGARQIGWKGGRSSTQMGDPHNLPFFRDMIKMAWDSGTEDIIVVANNDISFDPKLPDAIRQSCLKYGCYWAYRVEQPGGKTDRGIDVVAFTRKWWQLHHQFIPDLLFGHWWWDNIVGRVMEWSGCLEGERFYYHPNHAGWMVTRNRTPAWKYNWNLASKWLQEYGEPNGNPQER